MSCFFSTVDWRLFEDYRKNWAELGQAQAAADLVKLLLAAFFNWSKISFKVYLIDVQHPLIKKANFIFSFDVIGHFHIFRFDLGFGGFDGRGVG